MGNLESNEVRCKEMATIQASKREDASAQLELEKVKLDKEKEKTKQLEVQREQLEIQTKHDEVIARKDCAVAKIKSTAEQAKYKALEKENEAKVLHAKIELKKVEEEGSTRRAAIKAEAEVKLATQKTKIEEALAKRAEANARVKEAESAIKVNAAQCLILDLQKKNNELVLEIEAQRSEMRQLHQGDVSDNEQDVVRFRPIYS